MNSYDVIVVGVGAMGSSTCYHLASRGLKVLGIEQFEIPHSFGASGGFSRMIRTCLYEHPSYVPLVQEAIRWWRIFEEQTSENLLNLIGALYLGVPDGALVTGSIKAATTYNLPHNLLSRADLRKEFPQFNVSDETVAVYEPSAGFLRPERCISAMTNLAIRHGATIRGCETVQSWKADAKGVTVTTNGGTYSASQLVFTAGAWTDRLVQDLGVKLRVTRQVQGWVAPKQPAKFAVDCFKPWVYEYPNSGGRHHYGFPLLNDQAGMKIAEHYRTRDADLTTIDRMPTDEDRATFWPATNDLLPEAAGSVLAMKVCMYTNSPDYRYILDKHPQHDRLWLGAGFSGHGFKFASVIGRILADFAQKGDTDADIALFRLARF